MLRITLGKSFSYLVPLALRGFSFLIIFERKLAIQWIFLTLDISLIACFLLVLLSNSSIAATSLSWPQARGSSAISAKGVVSPWPEKVAPRMSRGLV